MTNNTLKILPILFSGIALLLSLFVVFKKNIEIEINSQVEINKNTKRLTELSKTVSKMKINDMLLTQDSGCPEEYTIVKSVNTTPGVTNLGAPGVRSVYLCIKGN